MATINPRLVELLKTFGEDNTSVWDCHGTWVAYHAAVERMAAKANILFDGPQMIVNDPEKKTVVISVSARMGERHEWSFGEVSPANNKNSYPYAMAEKRAKDRVALKLLGMAGLVYSEEEADDFKASRPADPQEPEKPAPQTKSSAQLKREKSWEQLSSDLAQDMVDVRSIVPFEKLKEEYRQKAREQGWPVAWLNALKDEFSHYERQIRSQETTTEENIAETFGGARVVAETIREQSYLEAGE